MAVISYTVTQLETLFGHTWSVVWPLVTNADTCAPIAMTTAPYRSVQAFGTFDSGSVAVHGSNEATNDSSLITSFVALHDAQGNVIAMTVAGMENLGDEAHWVKPIISSGGAGQSLSVAMLFRSPV